MASIAALSFVVSRWCRIPYWETFAAIWLIAAAAGAVNAIAAEWEDNAPGGFLNPRK